MKRKLRETFLTFYRIGRFTFSVGLLVVIFSLSSLYRVIPVDKFSLGVLGIYSAVSLVNLLLPNNPHLFEFLLDELFLFLLIVKGAFSYTFFSIFLIFPVVFSGLTLRGYEKYASLLLAILLQFLSLLWLRPEENFVPLQFALNSTALILMLLVADKLRLASEKQESYIEFLKEKKREAEIYKKLYRISADLAHEIKNPLASIKGAVELLSEGRNDKKLLKIVKKETERLDKILKDFLNLARPSNREKVKVDLKKVVEEVIESLESSGKEIEFKGENFYITIDPSSLRSVVENLLRNATQWAKSKVKVNLYKEGEWITLSVEDDGPGIPYEDRFRVFEPFFSRRKNGSGLGLALVKKITIDFGGFVFVEDSPLGGARFVLKIPLKEAK